MSVLPVAAAPRGRPPATGEEYLAMVREEARAIDAAMALACAADDGGEEGEEEHAVLDELPAAQRHHAPPDAAHAWQRRLLASLPHLRQAAARVRGIKGSTRVDLPPSDDRDAWIAWLNARTPRLALMHRISLTSARQALVAVADALSLGEPVETSCDARHMNRWLFALIIRIDPLVDADTTAALRTVARERHCPVLTTLVVYCFGQADLARLV